jgi:hypothetical protein
MWQNILYRLTYLYLAKLGVKGIPMLAVLGANGQMLETNAVQVMTA